MIKQYESGMAAQSHVGTIRKITDLKPTTNQVKTCTSVGTIAKTKRY
jgi:hypothetical protein